jgi:tetratricopeptide (TPR) repeat protein
VANQFASVAYPLSYGSALAVSYNHQSVAAFQGYDAQAEAIRTMLAADSAISGSYARTLYKDEIEHPVLNVGVTIKRISSMLDTASASAIALDLGAIYHLRPSKYWMRNSPAQELRIGVALRNQGSGMAFDSEVFPLPQSNILGLAWITHPSPAHTLTLCLDLVMSNYDKMNYNLGAEYFMFQLFSLRAGMVSGDGMGAGMQLGFGYRLSYLDVDYSMSPAGVLGTTQKFAVTARFGSSRAAQPLGGAVARVSAAKVRASKKKVEALKVYANDYLEMAGKNVAAREYTLAVDNMNKAFNLEPGLRSGPWGEKADRLFTLNDKLQLKETPVREKALQKDNEQSQAAGEAVSAYFDGKDMKAVLLAHAALGADPHGDPLFEELLYVLSDLTRIGVRRDEILPRTALVKEKLKRAAKGFYIQQFDMAARESEEVVLIDETNPMGWTRLGSAYYMLGDKAKARKAYEKVMELNPADEVTRKFMDSQGWKQPAAVKE